LKRSSRVFLLGGIILAIIVFVLIILLFSNGNGSSSNTPPPTTMPTVYATVDIPLGTQITSDMVAVHQVNITERSATAFASVNDVVGQIIRTQVLANTDLNQSMFTSSGVIAQITPNLNKGLRAMSVQVDQLTGVGTLIQAGDHVDAILGLGGTAGSCGAGWPALPPINPAATVKMIVQNLSVLGTLLPPPIASTPQASPGSQEGTSLNGQQEIVIVGVTAQQAEVLRYGQIDGCLSLVLRSPKDYAASSSAAPGASSGPVIPSLDPTTGVDLKIMIDQFGVLVPQVDPVIIPSASPAKK